MQKMSLRRSTGSLYACSGDMYDTLPLRTPVRVFAMLVVAFAIPKSSSLTPPS